MTSLTSITPRASSDAFALEPPYVFQAGDLSFLKVKLREMFDHVRNVSSFAAAGAVLSATDSVINAGDFQHDSEAGVNDAVGAIAGNPHGGLFVQATLRLVRDLRAAAAFRTDHSAIGSGDKMRRPSKREIVPFRADEPAPGSGDEMCRPSKTELVPKKRPVLKKILSHCFVGVVRSLSRRCFSFLGGFFAPVINSVVHFVVSSSTRLLR